MTNETGDKNNRDDRAWQGAVNWDLGLGGSHMSEVLWRCDALRAGKLYNRSLFGSRVEAEEFAQKMRAVEPDQMFNVESILASAVWN